MIKRLGQIQIDSPHIAKFSKYYESDIRHQGGGIDDQSEIDPRQTKILLGLTESIAGPLNNSGRGTLLLFRTVREHADDPVKCRKTGLYFYNCVHLVVKGTFWLYEQEFVYKFTLGDIFSHDLTARHSVAADLTGMGMKDGWWKNPLCGTIVLGNFNKE